MADNILRFEYMFEFNDGKKVLLPLELVGNSLSIKNLPEPPYPDWTRLEFHKCPHCPLDERLDPHCPVCVSLLLPVSIFRDSLSYEEADVTITAPERKYIKHTTLQEGLSSLVGLCMATSGCPVMEKLKPMVKFHLPFATADETMYRVLSMYLFSQYIRYKRGVNPDWDMKYLSSMYDSIRTLNKSVVSRLQNLRVRDASLNALLNLDCFAISVKFSINLEMMEEIEYLFAAYM